jgi:predicted NUDIX family phosphoesterase
MKSDRQIKAERLAERFKTAGRKPVVLEFAGVPKAGKTTTLSQLQAFLKRCGFRVEVVVERASICPIRDKKHANFNIWTACTTLAQVLEKTQSPPLPEDPDILILDRGLFDSICWLTMMERLSRIRSDELSVIEKFLRINDWKDRITAVVVMTAAPADSLEREKGYLPVEGAAGSIMNIEVLRKMLETTLATAKHLSKDFHIHIVNTSSPELRSEQQRTVEFVADFVLTVIEEQLREEILCVPRQRIIELFNGRTSLKELDNAALTECFSQYGKFLPREEVERSDDFIQALPVVVVRNKTGDVLRLRRKEASASNPLHQKLVIWAGGHVRIEDGSNGEAILRCALRELQEELRLSVEADELKPLGSIYVAPNERTKKHIALVYEWRANTDDVAVVLSSDEFFERRGTSLSGRFIKIDELVRDVFERKIDEVWSEEIVRELLAPDPTVFPPRLFEIRQV